jgi:hypothetical protein
LKGTGGALNIAAVQGYFAGTIGTPTVVASAETLPTLVSV